MYKRTVTLGVVLFICFNTAQAQTKIDVKTNFTQKAELTIIKNGIIETLKNSAYFKVVNTGEDYSLWITDINRYKYLNKRYVTVSIELRTPAFLTHGDLIISRRLSATYNPAVLKNSTSTKDLRKRIALLIREKKRLSTLVAKGRNEVASAAATVEPVSGVITYYLLPYVRKYIGSIHLNTSKLILAEAMYMGGKVDNFLINYLYH
jgi:hypothetical protein